MERIEILNKILEGGIVAILRVKDAEKVIPAAKCILAGGIHAIEVTMNTPNALECITELSKIEGILPGIGTVTDAKNGGRRHSIRGGICGYTYHKKGNY